MYVSLVRPTLAITTATLLPGSPLLPTIACSSIFYPFSELHIHIIHVPSQAIVLHIWVGATDPIELNLLGS